MLLGKKGNGAKAEAKAEKGKKKRAALVDGHTYEQSPSFTWHNGKCMTITQLYVRVGSNRQLGFEDIIDMIPVSPMDGIDLWLIVDDRVIKDDEKKVIIRKNAISNKKAIANIAADGSEKDRDDSSANLMRRAEAEDYDEYGLIIDSAEPIITFRVQLVIQGPDEEAVEEQLNVINATFDKRHEGMSFDSVGGDQNARLTKLFSALPRDLSVMTSTGSNYAGMNFGVRPGLNDEGGIPIGYDALSLSSSTAFFNFDSSTKKLGIIAMPHSSEMKRYEMESGGTTLPHVSTSSLIAQAAANDACIKGHAVKHLVLNGFDYFENGRYYRPRETQDIFTRHDVSKVTVNPLQGFGDVNEVVQVYNRLTKKIVDIFDALENLKLDKDDRAIILTVIQNFYMHNRLWSADAEINPLRVSRLVDADDPSTFPTMSQLINEFTTIANMAVSKNRELKADRVETLYSILSEALMSNMGAIGRPTSIKRSYAPQTYYDFGGLSSQQMVQVQMLNLLPYVMWTCSPGDMVIIHGAEALWLETLKRSYETVKAAQRKGIRVILAFDSVDTPASSSFEMASVFNLKGSWYVDLDTDVDWSIVGKMTTDELVKYEEALGLELSNVIKSRAVAKTPAQALVHRCSDMTNSFVHMSVIV